MRIKKEITAKNGDKYEFEYLRRARIWIARLYCSSRKAWLDFETIADSSDPCNSLAAQYPCFCRIGGMSDLLRFQSEID